MEFEKILDFGVLNPLMEIYPTMHFKLNKYSLRGEVEYIKGNTSFELKLGKIKKIKNNYGTSEEYDKYTKYLNELEECAFNQNLNYGDLDDLVKSDLNIDFDVSHSHFYAKLNKGEDELEFHINSQGYFKINVDENKNFTDEIEFIKPYLLHFSEKIKFNNEYRTR